MSNHISCATLRKNSFFCTTGWWYWFLFLSRSKRLSNTADVFLSALRSARGQAVCLHAWIMLFMEAQSSVKQRVLMLLLQGLQSLPSHGSQCWNLAMAADALSDAFGSDHPIMHAVGRNCLEGNIYSQRSLKTHCSDESGGILPSQLFIVHWLTIQLWNGPRSCGSEDVRDTQILACASPKQLFANRLNTGS